jgi:exosortase/archaeosortase family protein
MKFGTQRFWFLFALILLLAGIEIAVTLTYMARWIGVILIALGLGILISTARKGPQPEIAEETEDKKPKEEDADSKNLADVLISKLTLGGRINPFLPIIGCLLIIFVYFFNFMVRNNLELGVNDTITILLGTTLALYNYIPTKYNRERDFVLLFFIFLFLILVLPITLYSLITNSDPLVENSNSPFIYYLLAEPTSGMLNAVGIPASAHSIPPSSIVNGIPLTTTGVQIVYQNVGEGAETPWSTVMIGISCTGLYSVTIFISGFIAFILIEYGRFDIRVSSLLVLGIFTSWFANILRMTIIVAVGSHMGGGALRWTHENLGIFIFMLWVGLFWAIMFKLLVPKNDSTEEKNEVEQDEEKAQKADSIQED